MTTVTTFEAQSMLSQLIAIVARGEVVLITEEGLPVAQLIKPSACQPTVSANDQQRPSAKCGQRERARLGNAHDVEAGEASLSGRVRRDHGAARGVAAKSAGIEQGR